MTAATWILIYKKPQNVADSAAALKFFAWAYEKGDKMADDLDYVPMPANVVDSDQEDLGGRDQGRQRQAAVHELTLTDAEKGAERGAFLSYAIAVDDAGTMRPRRPLEWLL